MNFFSVFFNPMVFSATIRLATPLVLVAMGGSFMDRAKITNIGLESFLLVSAFFAMFGSYMTQNPWIGLALGIVSALVIASVFGLLVLHYDANPMVVGIALNLSAWGFTTLLLDMIFHTRGSILSPKIISFQSINLPLIGKIPFLSTIINNQNILVYFSLLLVAISYITIYYTPFGLRLRGVGYNSKAAQTAGVNILKYSWISVVISGVCAGIGGSYLSIGGISMFAENMSAGKGFLALAAIMIGKGNPFKVFLACLVFSYADALAVRLQNFMIPSHIVLMMPYLATIVVLFITNVKDIYFKKRLITS